VKTDLAKRELLAQAVDGRLKGYVAVPAAEFRRRVRSSNELADASHI
jgi:hypothetical protein